MEILCLESRMHGNVPVRFGRGRLDSLATTGLAAYLITSLMIKAFLSNGLRQAITRPRPLNANIWLTPYGYHSRSFL
jgi:hypothetical protein